LVAGCHPGDCHYASGNLFARRRFSLVKRFLEYLGLEPERFRVEWISAAEGRRFAEVIREMTADLERLGPNRKLREDP
jgi:coenzyme F420-reducing hydrogenase delta subunit